jgi:hypothetical protein
MRGMLRAGVTTICATNRRYHHREGSAGSTRRGAAPLRAGNMYPLYTRLMPISLLLLIDDIDATLFSLAITPLLIFSPHYYAADVTLMPDTPLLC